jgi:alpha-L-arabinofuranosidase
MKVNLSRFKIDGTQAEMTVLSGNADDENTFENLSKVKPVESIFAVQSKFDYTSPAMSLTVIRFKTKN